MLFLWIKPSIAPSEVPHQTINIRLQNSPALEELNKQELKQTPEETQQAKPQEEKQQDKLLEDPKNLPNSYRSDQHEGSSNQINNESGSIKEGERAKVKKAKQKKVVEKEVRETVTVEDDGAKATESIDNAEAQQIIDQDLIGVYGDYEDLDDESVDSVGESEEGIESTVEVETFEDISSKDVKTIGNTTLLSDSELSDTFVIDPFSEEESREFNVINRYLKQIWDVVIQGWVNPLSEGQVRQEPEVEIVFELNMHGSIRSPEIKRSSKFPQLDNSLIMRLEALRDHKFDMHESYLEKYRFFTLRWSGSRTAYELLPYENKHSDESR
jgi:outer membrane biosynthesis protein TonB